MFKIAYISTENPYDINNNGGIGTYTGVIARGIAQLGHQVHCVTIGDAKEREVETNLMVHYIPNPNTSRYSYIDNMKAFFKKISEIQCLYGLDLVESPEWMAQGFLFSNTNSPFLTTRLHTPLFLIEDMLNNQRLYRESSAIQKLERDQAQNSRGVTSPSLSLSSIIEDKWDVKSTVIANPIDISIFDSQFTDQFAVCNEPFLLFMGRLEYRKGVLTLAECLREILPCYKNLKVVFCGKDSLFKKKSMKSRILELCEDYKDRLIFINHANLEVKKSLLRQAIFVILPSIWENFSYVALEAMCMKKTIIASNVGGYSEMIEDGCSGYLVEPNSSSNLAHKIGLLLDGTLSPTGEKARVRVQDKYDIGVLSHIFESYYCSLI